MLMARLDSLTAGPWRASRRERFMSVKIGWHLFSALCISANAGFVDCAGAAEQEWSWQQQQAEVLPTGDLKWKPHPFALLVWKGDSLRYIDFDGGDDANDGDSMEIGRASCRERV